MRLKLSMNSGRVDIGRNRISISLAAAGKEVISSKHHLYRAGEDEDGVAAGLRSLKCQP